MILLSFNVSVLGNKFFMNCGSHNADVTEKVTNNEWTEWESGCNNKG